MGGCGGISPAPDGGGQNGGSCQGTACLASCTEGTFSFDGVCMPWTDCSPGTFVAMTGSVTEDRVCVGCPSGTFSASVNSLACIPWAVCPAGTFVASSPTAVSDRVCAVCQGGTRTTGANQSVCLTAVECPAGTFETTAATATSDPECASCIPGQYCAGGKVPAVACGADKWDHDRNPATECIARSTCSPGSFVVSAGSSTSDRSCALCASGTYSVTSDASACSPWSDCAPGSYIVTLPTSARDRACAPCKGGTTSTEKNQIQCLAPTDCPAGTVSAAVSTLTSSLPCTPCNAGEFCAGGSIPSVLCAGNTWDNDSNPATICVKKTDCAAGKLVSNAGSSVSDRVCSACPNGSYSTKLNATACSPWAVCAAGTRIVASPSASSDQQCASCDAGTFSNSANSGACSPWKTCAAGTYSASAPSSTLDRTCAQCPVNTYSSSSNASACTACPGAPAGATSCSENAVCGNEQIEAGETCDDGNTVDGDGCNHRCTIEACGDGLVQFGLGETCDDGNTVAEDGCDSHCHVEPFQTVSPVKVSAALSCTTSVANAARKIAIDGNGTIYAVMTCGSDAYVVVSRNRGQSYSAPVSLSSDLPNAPVTVSQVSVATGPTGVAYVAMMLSSRAVYLKTTLDFGSTWSSAVSIGTASSTGYGLSLQAFNDDIYIGYGVSGGVAVMRNHNQGTGSFDLTSVTITIAYFDLLYDARLGSLIVATDTPAFHVRSSTDNGVTFGAEVNPPGSEYYSDWALGNGRIYVSGTSTYSTSLYIIHTDTLASSTSVSGLPSVSNSQTRSLSADTSGNAFVASQLDAGGVQLDRLPYDGNALDTPRSLSATGGSPVVGPLPGGTGAAVVYTDGTSVYVTVQAY